MIVRFYNEFHYDYPLLEIDKRNFLKLKEILKKYQTTTDYNFSDFVSILKEKGIKVREINFDVMIFF